MKKYIFMVLIAGCLAMNSFAQSGSGSTPMAIESLMLMPKRGMEEKFEAAVLAHNRKFHPDGPYVAGLRKIDYGPNAGWYVWVFGPTAYGSYDTRPTKENGHEQDWTTTIDPLIETYGATGFWNFNTELSYGWDIFKKSKHYEIWSVDLKAKQYYRFKELMGKLRKVYESLGNTAFIVLDNNLHAQDGPDVVLIWSFNTYSDWQKDPGPKAAWEKMYGEGTWQTAMEEWTDMINGYNSEIRSNIQ
jgi:hypothetical protein